MSETKKSIWDLPVKKPDIREEELVAWENAVEKVRDIALAQGFGKKKIGTLADIAEGTFNSWYSGSYGATTNNITVKVQRWLDSYAEQMRIDKRILKGPDYVATPTATKVMNALLFAQQASEFSVITLGAGMGKTTAVREFKRRHNHVFVATMRPQTATVHGMLTELCRVFDVGQNNPAKFDTAIGEKLRSIDSNCLLILDEAQNLKDVAIDQLRYFLDECGCGIALLGNEIVYRRWGGEGSAINDAQLSSRIGHRIKQLKPGRDDITMMLDAWDVKDPEIRKLLATIANQQGALRSMVKTLQLASMLAIGEGKDISTGHIEQAWLNRAPEAA